MTARPLIHWRNGSRTACGLDARASSVRSHRRIAFVTCGRCALDRWYFTTPNAEGLVYIGRERDARYRFTVRRSTRARQLAIALRMVTRLNARLDATTG